MSLDGWGLQVLTRSRQGRAHRQLGLANQDALAFRRRGGDFVLALSDGLGSCPQGADGSRRAVRCCVRAFELLEARQLAIRDLASYILTSWKQGYSQEELWASCATVKVAFRLGNTLTALSLGDGALAVVGASGSLIAPEEAGDFTNETACLCPLTQPRELWLGQLDLLPGEGITVLCCTDGVAGELLPGALENLAREAGALPFPALRREVQKLLEAAAARCPDDQTIGVVRDENTSGSLKRKNGSGGERHLLHPGEPGGQRRPGRGV